MAAPRRFLLLYCALASVLLSSCASRQLSVEAGSFNQGVERANNEMLLRNVLRASQRQPLYLTSFSALHGGAGFAPGSTALSVPFGPGASAVAARTLSGSVGYTPMTFDMATLDGQEFMNGFTTPVRMQIIDYLWSEGLPQELIWMLFVQKVELHEGDPELLTDPSKSFGRLIDLQHPCAKPGAPSQQVHGDFAFLNYPEDATAMRGFKCVMRVLLGPDFDLKPLKKKNVEAVGPELDAWDAGNLKDLLAVKPDGPLLLTKKKSAPDRYQVQSTGTEFAWGAGYDCDTTSERNDNPKFRACRQHYKEANCKDAKPSADSPTCRAQEIVLTQRSPEALLYYLGEIVRVLHRHHAADDDLSYLRIKVCEHRYVEGDFLGQRDGRPAMPLPRRPGDEQWDSNIFDVTRLDSEKPEPMLEVSFDGASYGVPRPVADDYYSQCVAENPMHVLSVLNVLVSLQKSSKEAPAAGVVRLIP